MAGGPYGSSPLARGLPPGLGPYPAGFRIIPARAGFTIALWGSPRGTTDHPRSRGVYNKPATWTDPDLGSSPLARGLRRSRRWPRRRPGIIPARAGFTSTACCEDAAEKDHPRSRGVYDGRTLALTDDEGSSPLARGLRRMPHIDRLGIRIIPARAGFTSPHASLSASRRDHPRSRGVYGGCRILTGSASGSSPLARGLPHPTPP